MAWQGTSETDEIYGRFDDRHGIATIVFNRPERRNALTEGMLAGLAELLVEFEADPAVRVLVLTGAGGAFCSGGDVQGFNERGGEGGGASEVDPVALEQQRQIQRATTARLYRYRVPVLAALPGAAAGAGLGLALAADFRIASERAVMATAFAAVGLSGDFGVAWLLHQQVGPSLARELMMFPGKLSAERCAEIGLINWVVPESEFLDRTQETARRLADGPTAALQSIKDNLVRAGAESLEDHMQTEVLLHKQTGLTADHREAVRAFVEKRPPVFGRVSNQEEGR